MSDSDRFKLDQEWYRTHAHGVSPTRKDGKPRARNQYAAKCCFCGVDLAPGEGALEKHDGRWEAICIRGFEPSERLSRYRSDGSKL